MLRICSNENVFENRLEELKNNFLIPRNYHSKVIDNEFKKIRNLPGGNFIERRKKALEKKKCNRDESKNRIISPFDFNPLLPRISSVLNKHFKAMLFKKPDLQSTFSNPPMAALRLQIQTV